MLQHIRASFHFSFVNCTLTSELVSASFSITCRCWRANGELGWCFAWHSCFRFWNELIQNGWCASSILGIWWWFLGGNCCSTNWYWSIAAAAVFCFRRCRLRGFLFSDGCCANRRWLLWQKTSRCRFANYKPTKPLICTLLIPYFFTIILYLGVLLSDPLVEN